MNNISKIKEKSGHHRGGYDNNRKIKVGYHFLYVKFFIEVRSQTWTNSRFDTVSYIGNFLSKYLEIFVGVFKSKHILHFIPDSSINSVYDLWLTSSTYIQFKRKYHIAGYTAFQFAISTNCKTNMVWFIHKILN